jgi:protein-tyrosine-phosphatase
VCGRSHLSPNGNFSDVTELSHKIAREKIGEISSMHTVLFLCTGNSARSILAESILNREGPGRFTAYSAGSHPQGSVHPFALDLLRKLNYRTEHLRSKSWDEFASPQAPKLDFVFTVCDNAAGEVCPIWPGQPMTAHWGIPDPASTEGTEAQRRLAFADAYRMLCNRISVFTSLPIASLDRLTLQKRLAEIGQRKD